MMHGLFQSFQKRNKMFSSRERKKKKERDRKKKLGSKVPLFHGVFFSFSKGTSSSRRGEPTPLWLGGRVLPVPSFHTNEDELVTGAFGEEQCHDSSARLWGDRLRHQLFGRVGERNASGSPRLAPPRCRVDIVADPPPPPPLSRPAEGPPQ